MTPTISELEKINNDLLDHIFELKKRLRVNRGADRQITIDAIKYDENLYYYNLKQIERGKKQFTRGIREEIFCRRCEK